MQEEGGASSGGGISFRRVFGLPGGWGDCFGGGVGGSEELGLVGAC